LPETLNGKADFIYTARFAAAFPELVSDEQLDKMLPEWITMYKNAQAPWPDDTDDQIKSAFGLLMLAAKDRPVLLAADKYAQNLEPVTDYDSALISCAFACAYATLGAYDKAGELAAFDAQPIYSKNIDEATRQQELIEALRFYVMTNIDPAAAHDRAGDLTTSEYVSDIPERMHYIRHSLSKSGNTAEIRYTLDKVDTTLQLTDYAIVDLSLDKTQFNNLNALWISGSVGVYLKYTGRPSELAITNNRIGLAKNVSKQKGNEYSIEFDVTMPDKAAVGMYRIVDRLPGNMRYAANQESNARDSAYDIELSENQIVDIWFYYDGETCPPIKYSAMRVSDADAVVERAYISRRFDTNGLWGASGATESID
jgi:hypothetical protein